MAKQKSLAVDDERPARCGEGDHAVVKALDLQHARHRQARPGVERDFMRRIERLLFRNTGHSTSSFLSYW